jgi:hypothetical protein
MEQVSTDLGPELKDKHVLIYAYQIRQVIVIQ